VTHSRRAKTIILAGVRNPTTPDRIDSRTLGE
jgi:hypothetical protein